MQDTPWTKEEEAALAKMYESTRLSFAQMATRINLQFRNSRSRNALIGKINRLGMRDLRPAMPRGTNDHVRPRKPQSPPPKPVGNSEIKSVPVLGTITSTLFACEPIEEVPRDGILIAELNHTTCRWPLGPTLQKPPYEYCGRRVLDGRSWCTVHHARSRQEPKPRTPRYAAQ